MNQAKQIIEKTEERFRSIANPTINYDAEKGFAIQHICSNGRLEAAVKHNPASLAQAITNIAAIGLSLNPAEKLAYLIPRNVKVSKDKWELGVYLEPSYMGLCKLATDSGAIEWVQARCVFEKDTFVDNGPGEKPTHTYDAFSRDRGNIVGVYCVAKTKGGDYLTTTIDYGRLQNIKGRSEAGKKNYGPWVTDFEEQAKKSVIRNASKTWPKINKQFAAAVDISNNNEGFDPIVTAPELGTFTPEQKEHYDHLITKGDELGMYVFCETISLPIINNLYHSFEKGKKGKYQKIADQLYEKGREKFDGHKELFTSSLETEDYVAITEILESSSDTLIALLEDRLSSDHTFMLAEYRKNNGA